MKKVLIRIAAGVAVAVLSLTAAPGAVADSNQDGTGGFSWTP